MWVMTYMETFDIGIDHTYLYPLVLSYWCSVNASSYTLGIELFLLSSQIAVHFADLHDTPGRMQEKGVIAVSECVVCVPGTY